MPLTLSQRQGLLLSLAKTQLFLIIGHIDSWTEPCLRLGRN